MTSHRRATRWATPRGREGPHGGDWLRDAPDEDGFGDDSPIAEAYRLADQAIDELDALVHAVGTKVQDLVCQGCRLIGLIGAVAFFSGRFGSSSSWRRGVRGCGLLQRCKKELEVANPSYAATDRARRYAEMSSFLLKVEQGSVRRALVAVAEKVVNRESLSRSAVDVASLSSMIEGMARLATWAMRAGKSAVGMGACIGGAKQISALRPLAVASTHHTMVRATWISPTARSR